MFFPAPPFRNDVPCNDPGQHWQTGLNFSSGSHSAVPFYSASSSLEPGWFVEEPCSRVSGDCRVWLPVTQPSESQGLGTGHCSDSSSRFAPTCCSSLYLQCKGVKVQHELQVMSAHLHTGALLCKSVPVKCFMLLALWNNTEIVWWVISTNAPSSTHKPQTTETVPQHQWRQGHDRLKCFKQVKLQTSAVLWLFSLNLLPFHCFFYTET